MCGIVGIVTPNPSAEEIQRINDLLIHRGPDDSGIYLGEGIGIAARRLSIIDLEGGRQPIANEDQRIWLVANGEIVNAPNLRKELELSGHSFRTNSDIEVIVHGYEQWGEEFIDRLQGMFAIALWDVEQKRLLLARDRFGIKPLYYAATNGEFAFASEIRPILHALHTLPRKANPEAIWRLFEINFIPTPLTAFEGVHVLPAAHLLRYEDGKITLRAYWHPVFPRNGEHIQTDPNEAAEEFISRLQQTLNAWRMSDVPIGLLLSGGIDSTSVAALLTESCKDPLHTFHIRFTSKSLDESASAGEAANLLGCQHHETNFSMSDYELLPQVIRHIEAPQHSTVSLTLYRLYQACHEAGFKVIMSGEGSDELLGGYPWYQQDHRTHPYLKLPHSLRGLLARIWTLAYRDKRRGLALGMSNPVDRFLLWFQDTYQRPPTNFLRMDSYPPITEIWREALAPLLEGLHPFDQFLLIESRTRLPDWVNLQGDRMSMAHSVESRPAFLDHLLWEYVAKLPPELKLSPNGNKYLLRLGMKGRLPAQVLARPKRGLSSPINAWWRVEKLPTWVEEYLDPQAMKDTGYFDNREFQRLLATHRSRQANLSSLLTGVLTTQIWHYSVLKDNSLIRNG